MYKKTTKEIGRDEDHPYVDSHLLNLWDKRHRLINKYKKNKLNKALRKTIQRITIEAQDYAQELANENWLQTCDQLNGQLHTPKVWQILRTLLGQAKPRHAITKLQMLENKNAEELAVEFLHTFFPIKSDDHPLPDYDESGNDNSQGINSPFSLRELHAAMQSLKRNTTPGADGITYAMLRNLPDNYQDALLEHINKAWEQGVIPKQWKEAVVIPIPKTGKPSDKVSNFRPISLTSCIGKLMEKMVLERLEWHLEGLQLLPETMIGFRKHVSTQDAMLRIKNQVFDLPSTAQLRTIVGVDMQRAFDSVTHRAILENLKATKPGPRVYNYVKDFLSELK